MERLKEILSSPVVISIGIIVIGIGIMTGIVVSSNNKINDVAQLPYKEYAQMAGKPVDISTPTKVTIEEYGDFQCPACGSLYQTGLFDQVEIKYPDKVKIVFRQFPLTSIHPFAFRASEASLAAGAQGKFWEMYNKLYQMQDSFGNPATGPEVSDLVKMAQDIGVADIKKFEDEVKTDAYRDSVRKDMDLGNSKKVNSTPSIFINGKLYTNNWTLDLISQEIDKIN